MSEDEAEASGETGGLGDRLDRLLRASRERDFDAMAKGSTEIDSARNEGDSEENGGSRGGRS